MAVTEEDCTFQGGIWNEASLHTQWDLYNLVPTGANVNNGWLNKKLCGVLTILGFWGKSCQCDEAALWSVLPVTIHDSSTWSLRWSCLNRSILSGSKGVWGKGGPECVPLERVSRNILRSCPDLMSMVLQLRKKSPHSTQNSLWTSSWNLSCNASFPILLLRHVLRAVVPMIHQSTLKPSFLLWAVDLNSKLRKILRIGN